VAVKHKRIIDHPGDTFQGFSYNGSQDSLHRADAKVVGENEKAAQVGSNRID
jgi:hypothetical protein